MKIPVARISQGGLTIEESVSAQDLGLDRESICLSGPLKAFARISKITNAVTVELTLDAEMVKVCDRCLSEFRLPLHKQMQLSIPVESGQQELDLDADIREELLFSQPLKSLCRPDCKGLCSRCGGNLNEGKCSCDNI